jgi:UDP-glucose 4-epimerase
MTTLGLRKSEIDPETQLIPLVLAAARGGKSVSVFGDYYDTADGRIYATT